MSYRLACEMADRIVAIAPIAAHDAYDNCNPKRPVPVIHFHGIDDPCVNYSGGECGGCFAKMYDKPADNTWPCVSVPNYIDKWKTINGCSGKGVISYSNKGAECISYSDCNKESEVVLCSIEGGGHTWPGGDFPTQACAEHPNGKRCLDYKEATGRISYDISANEIMWEFFEKHSMQYI